MKKRDGKISNVSFSGGGTNNMVKKIKKISMVSFSGGGLNDIVKV